MKATVKKKQELLLKLSKYNLVLVGVHKSNVHMEELSIR